MDLPYYREYDLPWTNNSGQEKKFRRLLAIVMAATLFPVSFEALGEDAERIRINLLPFRGILTPGDISREQAIPNIVLAVPLGFGIFFVVPSIKPWQACALGVATFLGLEALQLVVRGCNPRLETLEAFEASEVIVLARRLVLNDHD